MAKAKAKRKAKASNGTTKSIIKSAVVENYEKTAVKTSDGTIRRSRDSGDEVAVKLRGKTLDELGPIADKAGLGDRWKEWKKLNPGQARMALGNAMRGQLRQKAKAKAEKKAA